MITVLAYRKCSTSLKALKWLDNSGVEYIERPIKEENPLKAVYVKDVLRRIGE